MGDVWPLVESGPPSEKVDLLVIGEGYTRAEVSKFHDDARRLVDALFEEEPFESRRSDFNVWGTRPAICGVGCQPAAGGAVPPNAVVRRVQRF